MRTRLRLARAERLLKVQEQMRGLAERDLADTRRRAAEVALAQATLLKSLADETMQGLFPDAGVRRLRSLAAETTALDAKAAREAEIVRGRGLAEKRAERQAEHLGRLYAQEREQADLREQLDALAARGAAGLSEVAPYQTSSD